MGTNNKGRSATVHTPENLLILRNKSIKLQDAAKMLITGLGCPETKTHSQRVNIVNSYRCTHKSECFNDTETNIKLTPVMGYISNIPVKITIDFFNDIKEIILSKEGFLLTLNNGEHRIYGEIN